MDGDGSRNSGLGSQDLAKGLQKLQVIGRVILGQDVTIITWDVGIFPVEVNTIKVVLLDGAQNGLDECFAAFFVGHQFAEVLTSGPATNVITGFTTSSGNKVIEMGVEVPWDTFRG
ncbi:hypothetical protein PGT21_036080 [Puccinia graminis f. sp. tritici]|uniref:Uncharacterized protein n=1 Tax=Puccinia graminis f. sp. tritici TaxID=56615 RepID=A0A5B0NGM8_PUCGR|nr:hypothetical protein PGT21_036080 [Puccinia graminis f. sp. tritici]